jgi:hypothetical protein
MRETRNAYRILVGKSLEKRIYGRRDDWGIQLRWMLEMYLFCENRK